jgi:hypothetical protein
MTPTGKVDKGWGFEIVFANNSKYCGKILVFNQAGSKTSLVLHKEKSKSWFVNAGKFKLTYIDPVTGTINQSVLEEGKTCDIAELSAHQLEALEPNSMIFEVGSSDIEDRIRLAPGDTQTKQPVQ